MTISLHPCFYELINKKWICKEHGQPSKHKVNQYSRWPCLKHDMWTLKELDALHEEAGLSAQWMQSRRRKEISDGKG